ncbi:MAG: PHP domain-containing protein [Elusimicrobia bacterium]|nr:PHP domain-containing protein [Elusimicrobiota bacterium]
MPRFDFHLHTHFSDGTLPPADLIAKLSQEGVDFFAITDHDSMRAHIGLETAALKGMRIFPGVEINTNAVGETLHILGFGRSLLNNAAFQEKLELFRESRRKRAGAIVDRLAALGVAITMEDVDAHAKESIGRPNIADALRKKGVVETREEAFHRFLLKGKPGYAPPLGPEPKEAIGAIAQAGGVAVLAHPGVAKINDERLAALVGMGLGGIEVYYPNHSPAQTRDYLAAARKYGLHATCGSDYHGPASGREEMIAFEFEERDFSDFLEAIN